MLKAKKKVTVEKILEKSLSYEDFLKVIIYANKFTITTAAYSRASALRWAFNWEKTNEGFEYWEKIHTALWLQDKRDKQFLKIRKISFAVCIVLLCFSVYKLITL